MTRILIGWYNIVLDEFQLEQGEKRTSFNLLYNFIGTCENLVRTTKSKIRVFLLGNTLEEASTILKAFNFLPQKFGRFYLRSKRCVIDNLEPTEEYLKDRYGSISDILGGGAMSNYTNELYKDVEQISKTRLRKPQGVIKFNKGKDTWFTIWDNWVITRWQGKRKANGTYADGVMFGDDTYYWVLRPHLQGKGIFSPERRQILIDMYNVKALMFKDLITQSYFNDEMKKLKPNG